MDYIIAGLGNPDSKYLKTRHNAGFLAIDELAKKHNTKIDRFKFKALTTHITIDGKKVLLLKPQTYMNLSGESVKEACDFYKIPPSNVLILVDDVTLDVGTMRIRRKGSHGGQNGLRNISLHLKTDEYPRVKIGVGKKPHPDYDLANWVLSDFSKQDFSKLEQIFKNVCDSCHLIIGDDVQEAMNKYNS